MTTPLNTYVAQIIKHPYFLKLKTVIENNAYHDHQPVYDHLLKTKSLAEEKITGKFITDIKTRQLFLDFTNQTVGNVSRKDILIIVALIHDIGKCLIFQENTKKQSINITLPDGTTICPGHEYQGSRLVPALLHKLSLPSKVVSYIANCVRLHDTFSSEYLLSRQNWPIDLLISNVKTRGEGLYKETLFNVYCDCFTAQPFQFALPMIEQIFNHPSLYTKITYLTP